MMFTNSILFEKLEKRSPRKAELIERVYKKFEDEIELLQSYSRILQIIALVIVNPLSRF